MSLERPRRLRRSPLLRALAAETRVSADSLMQGYFVVPGEQERLPIASMPGIDRLSIDLLLNELEADLRLGIRNILLFGVPQSGHKDGSGSSAAAEDALIPQAVRAIKARFGQELLVATDVCLCAYTDHGHCGVVERGEVRNDPSLAPLADMALAHARAGADIVAPSDMMDGRVGAIRQVLDASGYVETAILSYTAKYASSYYGPFREAAGSAPASVAGPKDRKTYQLDYRNRTEALREARLDVAEGADILMVKPALAYLDVISALRAAYDLPIACYNVSGEYALVKAAAEKGWLDEGQVVSENFHAFARAGASLIISYHVRDVLRHGWLQG